MKKIYANLITLLLLLGPSNSVASDFDCWHFVDDENLLTLTSLYKEMKRDVCGRKELSKVDIKKLRIQSEELEKRGIKVKKIIMPNERSLYFTDYPFRHLRLEPNEAFLIAVPKDQQERPVMSVTFSHKQPRDHKGWNPDTEWDDLPGLTSVQFLTDSKKCPWRYWAGPSSGEYGSKFAEPSRYYEHDTQYEFETKGHHGVDCGEFSSHDLKAKAIMVVNTGKDSVLLNKFVLKTRPLPSKRVAIHYFTEGTSFGDSKTFRGKNYGSGSYPGAFALNKRRYSQPKLPKGWRNNRGKLEITLEPGNFLNSIALAVGDSKSRGSGRSRLSVYLQRRSGASETLLDGENVPPQGMIYVSPKDCSQLTQPGDKIVIEAERDPTYLMGLKIGSFRPPELR